MPENFRQTPPSTSTGVQPVGVELDFNAIIDAAFQLGKGARAQALFGPNGVQSDADWSTLMNDIFSAANWPGIAAVGLSALRQYFIRLVKWRA